MDDYWWLNIKKITKCDDIHWREKKNFPKIKIIWNVKVCDFILKKFKVSKCNDYLWLKKFWNYF